MIRTPPRAATRIFDQFARAQIRYELLFLRLYIAYNAWYREVTGTSNDRRALTLLKERSVIWDDYCNGRTMRTLRVYMERLCEYTQQAPFPSTTQHWNGELYHPKDWRSLIEFWYQVRCVVVHGAPVESKYAWYAYETLNIFMDEITSRMKSCYTQADLAKLSEFMRCVSNASQSSERLEKLQRLFYQKYISSPDIWQVDMQRVE